MFILFDTSGDKGKVVLLYLVDTKIIQKEFAENAKSLVEVLSDALKSENKTLSDIKGMAVVVGVGRFTSTRVAVTTANTLAYALAKPVVAVSKELISEKIIQEIMRATVGRYVSAKYSAEARIGGK